MSLLPRELTYAAPLTWTWFILGAYGNRLWKSSLKGVSCQSLPCNWWITGGSSPYIRRLTIRFDGAGNACCGYGSDRVPRASGHSPSV